MTSALAARTGHDKVGPIAIDPKSTFALPSCLRAGILLFIGSGAGMRRREFITMLGGLTAAWPVVARGQPKQPKIGVLFPANPEPIWSPFREAMREQEYAEGRNIQFELRSADGKPNLLDGLAADLVRLKVDVTVAVQTPAAQAAKQATTEIPIVISAADPVGTGLVTSLARPGGNITGMSVLPPELGGKLLELSRDLLPATSRVAVLANANDPFTKPFIEEIDPAVAYWKSQSRPS